MEYLFRKLPSTVVKMHHDSDTLLFSQLSKLIPLFDRKIIEVYTAAFSGCISDNAAQKGNWRNTVRKMCLK